MKWTWSLVVFGVLTNALASVLVKSAAQGQRNLPSPWGLLPDWRLLLAVASYGIAFLLYAKAVTRLPLNVAHPVTTAGAIILVGAASALLFREPISLGTILGYGLLLCGIVVLALSQA